MPTVRDHVPSISDALLWTADDVAELLRTSRSAVYMMVYRGQLPGLIRIGRRLLFRREDLLDWLDQNRAPSLTGRTQR